MPVAGTRELHILNEIAQELNRSRSVENVLDGTLELVSRNLGFETGWVWLQESPGTRFYLAAARNLPPYLQEPVRMTGTVCWCLEAFLDGDFVSKNVDAIECSRLRPAVRKRETALTRGIAYHASVLLRSGERQLGIMNLTKPGFRKVSRGELRLLSTIAYQVGIAIDRARLADQEREMARLQERASLARDLHDTFAQDLTAITLHLEAALHALHAGDERARLPLERALGVARENVQRARQSVEHLRRGALHGRSLEFALGDLAHEFTSQTGIPVHVELSPVVLDAESEAQLFAIVIEALTNVRRHASAKHVTIVLDRKRGLLELRVTDDGAGYRKKEGPGRFGITGMRERARVLGGTFSIRQVAPRGTVLAVKVPRR